MKTLGAGLVPMILWGSLVGPSCQSSRGRLGDAGTTDSADGSTVADAPADSWIATAGPDVVPLVADTVPFVADVRFDVWTSNVESDAAAPDTWTEPPPKTEPPKDIPARQKVIFRITNTFDEPRYVGDAGNYCDPYTVSGLRFSVPYQCGCECPIPPKSAMSGYLVVAPGRTRDLVWDGRKTVTYGVSVTCSTMGPPSGSATVTYGVAQPAPAGHYTAELAIEETIPTNCRDTGEKLSCDRTYNFTSPGTSNELACPAAVKVSVEFDLPEEGEVIVPVQLGDGVLDGGVADGGVSQDAAADGVCLVPLSDFSVDCPSDYADVENGNVTCRTYEEMEVGTCATDHLLMFRRNFGTHAVECFYDPLTRALTAGVFMNDVSLCGESRTASSSPTKVCASSCTGQCEAGADPRFTRLTHLRSCCQRWAYPIPGCPALDASAQ